MIIILMPNFVTLFIILRINKKKIMALGIERTQTMTILTIPLKGACDKHWEDRSWICEHLHQLADYIEKTKFEIRSIGMEMDSQYQRPRLEIKGHERNEDVIADLYQPLDGEIEMTLPLYVFQGFPDSRKWEIFKRLKNIDWRCYNCGNKTDEPEHANAEKGAILCKHCDEVLTHYNRIEKYAPFNWIFSSKDK
jgi:hypothetical protein